MIALFGFNATKPHEGGHLVTIAANRFFHLMNLVDIIIGDAFEQLGLAVGEAPDDAV